MASSTPTPTASANSSGGARSSSRQVVPATRRLTPKSGRPSKKLRWRPQPKPRAVPGEAAEGSGLRRGTFRADQLAQEALLSQGVPSAVHREALLQVDLPVRGTRTHDGGELLPVPAGDGRRMPGGIPRRTIQELSRAPPADRAGRRLQPPLQEDRLS